MRIYIYITLFFLGLICNVLQINHTTIADAIWTKNACTDSTAGATVKKAKATKQSIWPRLTGNFKLKLPNPKAHKNLQNYINKYSRPNSQLNMLSNSAEPYLYHIMEALEERDLPGELALLPMVESEYKPTALSKVGASGLWQFMPSTGRICGLKQDRWYDGRRDVAASTKAALDHLEYLHTEFSGDWLLAFAAYNSGEGRVKKAIKKNKALHKPTDFWSLDLPTETKHYVPKLLALAHVIRNRDQNGVKLVQIANEPYFKSFTHKGQINLQTAAKLAKVDLKEIKRLNPAYKQAVTHPAGPHKLLVPVESFNTLSKNMH